jgi:hypothetical protein
MSDDLVYKIFVELAVLDGKRDVNGNWKTSDSKDLSRLLRRAFLLVTRASNTEEDEHS